MHACMCMHAHIVCTCVYIHAYTHLLDDISLLVIMVPPPTRQQVLVAELLLLVLALYIHIPVSYIPYSSII